MRVEMAQVKEVGGLCDDVAGMRVETTQVQEALECLNAQAPSATQALSEVSGHAANSTRLAQEKFARW